jgi:hypothetical protein
VLTKALDLIVQCRPLVARKLRQIRNNAGISRVICPSSHTGHRTTEIPKRDDRFRSGKVAVIWCWVQEMLLNFRMQTRDRLSNVRAWGIDFGTNSAKSSRIPHESIQTMKWCEIATRFQSAGHYAVSM